MSSPAADERTVNVAHEALIRGWPRLRGWIDGEREGLRIHRRVTETAGEWQSRNRDVGFLYRGFRLDEARRWRSTHEPSLNELERQFLETSHEVQRREHRAVRARRWAAVGILSFAVVALSVYAYTLYRAQQVATSRQLAATAMARVKREPRLATRLALEAHRLHPSQESESVLRIALSSLHDSTELTAHGAAVYTARFSPDGNLIVTASADKTALIWNAHTLKVFKVLEGHDSRVYTADFSPDGSRVVTAGADHTARIWDVQTGKLLWTADSYTKCNTLP
jgi:hypothetical protein